MTIILQIEPRSPDQILDALIGHGLTGAPRGQIRRWIEWDLSARAPVLLLDTHSGLDVDSGEAAPPTIQGAATLPLALPRIGVLLLQAQPFAGDLYLSDIEIPPQLYRHLGLDVPAMFARAPIIRLT